MSLKNVLMITEKPSAARAIAYALNRVGKPTRIVKYGLPYFEICRDRKIIIVPALGHMYTVSSLNKDRTKCPILNYDWLPRYLTERGSAKTRNWLKIISRLALDADTFIDACDYDVEGSIIGYSILKYACGGKETIARRMKFSTLTSEELEKSYLSLEPSLNFALIEAGITRHEVDWLFGINLSRVLTEATAETGIAHQTISAGRVQGPSLKLLTGREKKIELFVPIRYWTINLKVRIGSITADAEYSKQMIKYEQETQEVASSCKRGTGIVEKIENKKSKLMPPVPFNLGALQAEAYRRFKYSPIATLAIAQKLYLDALISYPRTNSQKLPEENECEKILVMLSKNGIYVDISSELLTKGKIRPLKGRQCDPAHPAIYPTGKMPRIALSPKEKNIYDLVVRRFLNVFEEPMIFQTTDVTINVNGKKFSLEGKKIIREGWLRFCSKSERIQERLLPPIIEGQVINVERIIVRNKFTLPPSRYNPGSLLKEMELRNIGTKTTRAGIIQTLYDRKYIQEEKIRVTDLGSEVVNILRKYCPDLISNDFTKQLEGKMDLIQEGKESKQRVISDTIDSLKTVIAKIMLDKEEIGRRLSQVVNQVKLDEETIGPCPNCQGGRLVLKFSKIGRRFVGCSNYFASNCKTTFSLPQKGALKSSKLKCEVCSLPTMYVLENHKNPVTFCLNPECLSRMNLK
jgi:DNA topoisomerase I